MVIIHEDEEILAELYNKIKPIYNKNNYRISLQQCYELFNIRHNHNITNDINITMVYDGYWHEYKNTYDIPKEDRVDEYYFISRFTTMSMDNIKHIDNLLKELHKDFKFYICTTYRDKQEYYNTDTKHIYFDEKYYESIEKEINKKIS